MSHGIYVSMSQASADMRRLERIADDLANQDTVGYVSVAERYSDKRGPQVEDGPQLNAKVMTEVGNGGVNLKPGPLMQTGRNLDVALPEGTFLKVESKRGGPSYTRAGNITVDHKGTLRIGHRPLLNVDGAPVQVPPGVKVRIHDDGTIQAQGQVVAQLPMFALSGEMTRTTGDEIRLGPNGQAEQVAARVTTGALEGSNADPLRAVVDMVTVQRSFAHAMQAIDTYSQIDSSSNDIGRIR